MKLRTLKLKNFRGYKAETTIEFNDLTAFVGKNDVGKSTVLEALDIFFNENKGTVKLDKDDFNIEASEGDRNICISLVFSELPATIILDDSCETTLEKEYMLNREGLFEIIKEFKGATSFTTKIRAYHPTNEDCKNLLLSKQKSLQEKIVKLSIPCEDKRKNSLMREAIWRHYSASLDLQEIDLDVSSKDGELKDIWDKLQTYIPAYSLFQSDRKNSDSDDEVQEPLKMSVRQILKDEEITNQLNSIALKVKESLQKISDLTLDKLREMNPDLADSLHPQLPDIANLKWQDVFKNISITGDFDIPINKRGSGVRRLILLNFFRAEAERNLSSSKRQQIIYAIEEPETSQHYEHQKLLISSLKEISEHSNAQVILTTHSGDIIKALDWEDIRLILNSGDQKIVRKVQRRHLPTPSVSEVNYCVFDMPNIEYHNELYGYLQSLAIEEDEKYGQESKFDSWLVLHGLRQTKIWKNDKKGTITPFNRTLQTYIRNKIHHPENLHNVDFSEDELNTSIQNMIEIVDSFRSRS